MARSHAPATLCARTPDPRTNASASVVASVRNIIASKGLIIWQSRSFRKAHGNLVTGDADIVFRHTDARILDHRSRPDLIRPPMPRAGDDVACDAAFAERAAAMQAHVVEREELIAQPEQRDVPAGDR